MLMVCMSIFAGCSLTERDDKAYYEATVATIYYKDGTTDSIQKRELITAYNSYGYNYVESSGMTLEEAFYQTLDSVVDRRMTVRAVEDYYETHPEEGKLLTDAETTYLWDQTYNAVYGNFKTYFEEITGVKIGDDESTSEESNKSVFVDYTATVEVDENLQIVKKSAVKNVRSTYKAREYQGRAYDYQLMVDGQYVFKQLMYDKLVSLTTVSDADSAKAWKSAYNNYVSEIKESYEYLNMKNGKDAFYFEMDRVYDILKSNYMVEKYNAIFDQQQNPEVLVSNVTVAQVLKHYESKIQEDYVKFNVKNDAASFETGILTDTANIDYILDTNNAVQYFSYAYIKLDLTEGQTQALAELNEAYETPENYATKKAAILSVNNFEAKVRNEKTGEVEKTISASELLQKVETAIDGAGENVDEIAKAFRTYLYLYNDDDTLKGAEYNAVAGVDPTTNKVVTSEKIEGDELKEALYALYANGNAKIGDLSELVVTENGCYLFFYAGKVENLFGGINENFTFKASERKAVVDLLRSTKLNIFSSKTLFDKLYEECVTDNFAVFQNLDANAMRLKFTDKIEYIENNIKDLYK